ncbi:hypothetical protein [Amycolatopsis sp. cmx-4-68]|uniref:hypothetical protein n=1 Tax=Amycolatopsis sp. cmx-4-68 TaxID=2790938 RepID=UPI00397BAFEB
MTVGTDCEPIDEVISLSAVEAALRWLATRKEGHPLRFLRYAIDEPSSESAAVLRSLVAPVAAPSGRLAAGMVEKLVSLDGQGWRPYTEIGRAAAEVASSERVGWRARAASKGAQPVFVERMVVTVVMHRRTALRRITERDIVACEDGVDGYDVHALTGWTHASAEIPVTALWGCRLVASPGAHPGDPVMARLRFRRTLRRGEWYTFVSEALDGELDEERRWLNVDVDHHGIVPGVCAPGGKPISGLTIQINFDEKCLPEACWWYAEQLEFERTRQPPDGDPHLLAVEDGFVRHTFLDGCHPREDYGIAFKWKSS